MNGATLRTLVHDSLAGRGFERRHANWYRQTKDTIQVINIQKSDFGGQHFINLAICLLPLWSFQDYPREEQCHIRTRLDALYENKEGVRECFDLENQTISLGDRKTCIHEAMTVANQWFDALSTCELVKHRLELNPKLRNRATLDVRRFLGIE